MALVPNSDLGPRSAVLYTVEYQPKDKSCHRIITSKVLVVYNSFICFSYVDSYTSIRKKYCNNVNELFSFFNIWSKDEVTYIEDTV